MPRKPDVPCAGTCGRLLWTGSTKCRACRAIEVGTAPPVVVTSTSRRRKPGTPPPDCAEPHCTKPARSRRLCKTHYNLATGHYIGAVVKDVERERARLRIKTHRRKDWSRLTDITPEFELGLRNKARRCPSCDVKMTDAPYLPHSKEMDHIVPRGVGGTHTIGNVRIICRSCNLSRPDDGSDYSGPVTLWAEVA